MRKIFAISGTKFKSIKMKYRENNLMKEKNMNMGDMFNKRFYNSRTSVR